ncbi:MAG TPA: Hsp20/alpha crystallin family protein [Thermoanaerobaculia bacterium]|nr:Hsp20/alpha crystallin family protein [Thermoanaerobaculia bacterium]
MNALTRRVSNPFPALMGFEPFVRSFLGEDVFSPTESGRWMPQVDIRETEAAFEVAADLPGMRREDVEVTVENGVLTITGARAWDESVDRNSYHRIERSYGRFVRSFTLPRTVRTDDVKAHFDNGVLYLTLPKADEARPRKIQIN